MNPQTLRELLLLTGLGIGVVSTIIVKQDKRKRRQAERAQEFTQFLQARSANLDTLFGKARRGDADIYDTLDRIRKLNTDIKFNNIVKNYNL